MIPRGAPVDIWESQSSSYNIPEIAFVPISVEGIEFADDYEPLIYQANRTLLEANAALELKELQQRNRDDIHINRNCKTTPLFDASRRAVINHKNSGANTPYYYYNTYPQKLMATYTPEISLSYPTISPRDYYTRGRVNTSTSTPTPTPMPYNNETTHRVHRVHNNTENSVNTPLDENNHNNLTDATMLNHKPSEYISITDKMYNSIRGSLYDLKHWQQLPPVKNKNSPPSTSDIFRYVVTRDNRMGYLVAWLILILILFVLLGLSISVIVGSAKKDKHRIKYNNRVYYSARIPY